MMPLSFDESPAHFHRTLLKYALAQLIRATFQAAGRKPESQPPLLPPSTPPQPAVPAISGISDCALELFCDLFVQYLQMLGRQCRSVADHSGRHLVALTDLGMVFGKMNLLNKNYRWLESQIMLQNRFIPRTIRVPIQHRGTEAKHLESANDQLLLSDNVPQDFKRLMEPLMPEPLPPACQPYFPGYPAQHSYKQTPIFPRKAEDVTLMRRLASLQSRQLQDNMRTFIRDAHHTLVDWIPTDMQTSFDLPVLKLVDPKQYNIELPIIQCEQSLFIERTKVAENEDTSVS